MLRLIDEECNINNGTDQSMLDKLNQFLKNNEYYEIPQRREQAFIVAHYAGKVKYQITVCSEYTAINREVIPYRVSLRRIRI